LPSTKGLSEVELTVKALAGHAKAMVRDRRFSKQVQRYMRNAEHSSRFTCPVCDFVGTFMPSGERQFALCPSCLSKERHRLQALVVQELARQYDFASMRMLHVAPEPALSGRFRTNFGFYQTADIEPGMDLQIDLRRATLPDASFDVIYASHVLEHIDDDRAAIGEIQRILAPGGFAILPVPVLVNRTFEYNEAVPEEEGHVRAPGPDYFERYVGFKSIRVWTSADFDERYQTWAIEDRTRPSGRVPPDARVMYGARHLDYVPVCFV
jgi:SAM-dependent methyltransferase